MEEPNYAHQTPEEQPKNQQEQATSVPHYCSARHSDIRTFSPEVSTERQRLIVVNDKKWVNGTILRYYFFTEDTDGEYVFSTNGSRTWRTWKGSKREMDVVRDAFKEWADVGIGLEFKEVFNREEAEIRIGFMDGDGAWSYIGRDILEISSNNRTMNFGWNIAQERDGIDVAIHEIGHTLGFPHEHQNPNAGIVWDEDAVYESLAGHPNYWPPDVTYRNIIRKINPDEVQGSNWDPDSIMHYPFGRGMIRSPREYRNGLSPKPGLSPRDKSWVKHFYPPIDKRDELPQLEAMKSVTFNLQPSEQKDFVFIPELTKDYNIGTFGEMDTVMVLFEDINGDLQYRDGDDDSGKDYNALIKMKLIKGNRYVIRLRLYFKYQTGDSAIMVW